jgi:hypothetical protein
VLLGKILRISVASDAFPADPNRDYAIPATNPFPQGGGAPANLGPWLAQSVPRLLDPRHPEPVGVAMSAKGPGKRST